MSLDLSVYTEEIFEFLTKETLEAIDWGVLDLSHIRDLELRCVLMILEESLTRELKDNYKNNATGIFRVSYSRGMWCYRESGCVIKAYDLKDLKKTVTGQHRIWYVFDECSLPGECVRL